MNHFLVIISLFSMVYDYNHTEKAGILDAFFDSPVVSPYLNIVYLDDSGVGYILLDESQFVEKDLEKLNMRHRVKIISKEEAFFRTQEIYTINALEKQEYTCLLHVVNSSKTLDLTLRINKVEGAWKAE